MSDENNVIQAFRPAELPEQTLLIEKRPAGKPHYCSHEKIRIDAHERTIHYARCDQAFDPFDFLHQQALTLQRAWQDHASVKRELSDLQDRVTALKKEEKSLRGKVDRLKDKIGVVDVRGKSIL